MAYHAFERICGLWLERIRHHFVILNLPLRYTQKKRTKYSPSSCTTDIDIISFDPAKPRELYLYECKSNINQTFSTKSRTRLKRQLEDLKKHSNLLPNIKNYDNIKLQVFGIKIAKRVLRHLKDVKITEGEDFEREVLEELIMSIGNDPKIDPKDDILSVLRLLWHFGVLNDRFYAERAKQIVKDQPKITANKLKAKLGLIAHKTSYCKELLSKLTA
jgi:hypothetical protein